MGAGVLLLACDLLASRLRQAPAMVAMSKNNIKALELFFIAVC
jgi:hypothetical protein